MTRIEKLEKEIQELRLEVARLEGRVQELSIHHVPLQPRIPKVQPWDLPNYRWGGSGDVLCQENLGGLITCTTGSNTISVPCSTPSTSTGFENYGEFTTNGVPDWVAARGNLHYSPFEEEDFKID